MTSAVTLLDRLHGAQNQFYGGGDGAALTELLTSDVAWSVPGNNRIAGSYHGLAEVFAYFRHRRDLAGATFRMHRKDILVGEGRRLAALTDGTATLAGRARQWSTVGLYDVTEQGCIAARWLHWQEQAACRGLRTALVLPPRAGTRPHAKTPRGRSQGGVPPLSGHRGVSPACPAGAGALRQLGWALRRGARRPAAGSAQDRVGSWRWLVMSTW